ncbi:ParA family protein [Acetobacter persici]|uniref:ParA family protein n=1 Tax=Acetobacter persici TaxID=1076596 RepID=UPI0005BA95E1|nr:ParA family protein [Acetobacter persici]MCG0998927.1 ParA family protein [Acetobacter persici]
MPVIAIANPKGGTGKTTTALVVGTTLTKLGYTVTIIDADPRQNVAFWKTEGYSKNPIRVEPNAREKTIIGTIKERALKDDIVLIDLEGTASLLLSRAISRADLVLIPMQANALDARGAADVMGIIEAEEEAFDRSIDARIIFTRTNPTIVTRIERDILKELQGIQRPYLKNHLYQRQAYNALFAGLLDLDELDEGIVKGLPKARENALELSNEIISILEEKQSAAS